MIANKCVKEVMTNDFAIIEGLTTVKEAIKIAKDKGIKMLIVNKRDENDEYGLVLMNDIAKEVLSKDRAPDRVNVYEIMVKPAFSVLPSMKVKYCARFFERFGISHAPVIENGAVLGVVSYSNIVLRGMLD